jgi:glycosyltransferase involved in cell wall biosynthesis
LDIQWIQTKRSKTFVTSLFLHLRFLSGLTWAKYCQRWGSAGAPDWICANMAWPSGWAAQRLARRLKTRYAIWHHGSDIHGGRPEGAGLAQRLFLRRVWRGCSKALFVSDSLRRTAERYGVLPPHGLVPSMVDPFLMTESDRWTNRREESRTYFLFLGRFEAVKEPLIAIQAVDQARRQGIPVRMRMVGQGKLESVLAREIARLSLGDVVTLEKEIDHLDLPGLFSQAIALVLPSRAEGLSLTVLEAGAFSVPCLAADTPGLRDSLGPHASEAFFPVGDSQALAVLLVDLFQHPDKRSRLGEAARKWSKSYTPGHAAEAFAAALGEPGTTTRMTELTAKEAA